MTQNSVFVGNCWGNCIVFNRCNLLGSKGDMVLAYVLLPPYFRTVEHNIGGLMQTFMNGKQQEYGVCFIAHIDAEGYGLTRANELRLDMTGQWIFSL